MTGLDLKLKDLKKIVKDPTQEDLEVIGQLGKRIKKLELYESWMNHPTTKEILKATVERLKAINNQILSDDVEDTKLLKVSKKLWVELLDIFGSKSENENLINQDIEAGITKFKDYLK